MTKEELKLEAIRYLENFKDCANCKNRWGDCADQLDEYCLINGCCFATPKEQDIYLAGAEPREKQIAELSKHIVELQNDKGELIDRVKELEKRCNELFFQVNEKTERIADLEKENAELKEKLKEELKTIADKDLSFVARFDALEKENAELKEELKDANKKVVHLACNQNKDLERKINKAKEIIKNLMVFAEMDDREYEKEYKEAEQFLSEVENV